MNKSSKLVSLVTSLLVIMFLLNFPVYAKTVEKKQMLRSNSSVMVMSHRGDESLFPSNSLEAVLSAYQNEGADMVSVSIRKTSDDVLVVCDDMPLYNICETDKTDISDYTYDEIKNLKLYRYNGEVSDFNIPKLETLIETAADEFILVIDNAWEFRDEIYEICGRLNKIESVMLRTDESSKQVTKWIDSKGEKPMDVIGIYDGNIIFNAISHIDRFSKANQPAVQYQSKNYFNVMYGSLLTDRFSNRLNSRAIAPMYDKDLCGQRSDNANGWDEMISKGFTVIETNNVKELKKHLKQCSESMEKLSGLVNEVKDTNLEQYSQVSAKNFSAALKNAQDIVHSDFASLNETQERMSVLIQAINNLTFNKGNDLQKGNINITAGKIIAVVVFGALILAGEIYVHKMHKPKKGKKH